MRNNKKTDNNGHKELLDILQRHIDEVEDSGGDGEIIVRFLNEIIKFAGYEDVLEIHLEDTIEEIEDFETETNQVNKELVNVLKNQIEMKDMFIDRLLDALHRKDNGGKNDTNN